MSAIHQVLLKDLHAKQFVEAKLIDRIDIAYAAHADDAWLTYVATVAAQAVAENVSIDPPEHAHWRWEPKVRATAHLLSYPTMAIECESQVQGLMMLLTDGEFGRLPAQEKMPLVYVHFLATAPWNLGKLIAKPRFAGVGTVLMRAAVEFSIDLGFKGRVGLHSLPGAETWYEKLGMQCLGKDLKKKMKYYEMTADQATTFIL